MAEYYDDRPAGNEGGNISVNADRNLIAEFISNLDELNVIAREMKVSNFLGVAKGQVADPDRFRQVVNLLNENRPAVFSKAVAILDNTKQIVATAQKTKKQLEEESARLEEDLERQRGECDRACNDAIRSANDQALAEKNRIISDAEAQAAAILETARRQAQGMIEQHAITQAAQSQAESYLAAKKAEADEYAKSVRDSADDYANKLRAQSDARREAALAKLGEICNENLQRIETAYRTMEEDLVKSYNTVRQGHADFTNTYANKR